MLDGNSAPAPIGFDLSAEEVQGLPQRKENYLGGCQQIVSQFVQQYYQLFDSDDRSPLIQAYHHNVVFSTSFWFNPDMDKQTSFDVQNSRNLLKIESANQKKRRLKHGSQTVIKFFTGEFPKTKHLLETLRVDVVHESKEMLCFVVTGLYEEPNNTRQYVVCRSFSRVFTTVPQGEGLVIISEQFSLSNIPKDRKTSIVNAAAKRLASPEQPSTSGATNTDEKQLALVQQMMTATKMNDHWSRECLLANNWDLEKAGLMFQNLMAEGKIPPEAFLI